MGEIVKKNKLMQFLCGHSHLGWYRKDSKFQSISGERQYLICKNCGKVIDEQFLEYEGMGFK